jgi:hypothetical protein
MTKKASITTDKASATRENTLDVVETTVTRRTSSF